MPLTREATIVLDIFRRLHTHVGERVRYEEIYAHARVAHHARKGIAELERLSLIVARGDEA